DRHPGDLDIPAPVEIDHFWSPPLQQAAWRVLRLPFHEMELFPHFISLPGCIPPHLPLSIQHTPARYGDVFEIEPRKKRRIYFPVQSFPAPLYCGRAPDVRQEEELRARIDLDEEMTPEKKRSRQIPARREVYGPPPSLRAGIDGPLNSLGTYGAAIRPGAIFRYIPAGLCGQIYGDSQKQGRAGYFEQ